MPKNPDGGPTGPLDTATPGPDNGGPLSAAGRGPNRPATDTRASAGPEARPGAPEGGGGAGTSASASGNARTVSERKKQFLIAPRHADALSPMSFAPLQLSVVESALRGSPDIEVVDTVGPKNVVGVLADGMGGGQGVLVARMTEQKAGVLHQQGQGRLLVERDQHLGMMDPQLRPTFVTNVVPTSGPAFTAVISIVGKDGQPVAGAEVSLFGSMLPATAVTDESGQVTLSLYGESASSISSLYVKPKSDFWSFYQRDPDVSSDEPNVVTLRPLSDWPSLADFPRQKVISWGQKAMRIDQLPGNYRGQGIKIAIVDSGAATTHESLNRIRAGFDIVNKRSNPNTWNEDTLGHGSHCAGVVAGNELAFGIRGIAPDAEIHVCKLFPGGQISQLIDALEYCIDNQIDVVNLSLGGAQPSEALEQQIMRAKRAGIACIVAAGNSGGPVQYPASSPNVLAVAAIGKLDEFPPDSYHAQTLTQNVDANGFFSASFSCYGPQVGVCGPGVAVTSSVPPNNWAAWDGTSMAAPHITGLAGLVLAHHPDFQGVYKARSPERVERLFQIIKASAHRVSLAEPGRVGLGLPDAVLAVGLQQSMAAGAIAPYLGQPHADQAQAFGAHLANLASLGQMTNIGAFANPGNLGNLMGGLLPIQQQMALRGLPFGMGVPGYNLVGW